jgi:8-oxo-dGTP pyrophosphatase MutT (NUDIX family)
VFRKFDYAVNLIAEPFGNLKYRNRTALILLKDSQGRFILGTSGFYPDGIVRMIGGGIDEGEELIVGAIREIKEEIGISATPEELVELAMISISGEYKGETYTTIIYVYFLDSDEDDYLAGDDVTEIIRLTEEQYRDLVKRFFALDSASWRDYGQVYGFVHQVALEEYLEKNI